MRAMLVAQTDVVSCCRGTRTSARPQPQLWVLLACTMSETRWKRSCQSGSGSPSSRIAASHGRGTKCRPIHGVVAHHLARQITLAVGDARITVWVTGRPMPSVSLSTQVNT